MKPDTVFLLNSLAGEVAEKMVPQLDSEYARADGGLIVELLLAAAGDIDTAASSHIEENRQLRSLFSEAASVVADEELGQELKTVAEEEEQDYKISSLQKKNNELCGLLVRLHAHVEILERDGARKIEDAIWNFLSARTFGKLPIVMSIARAKEMLNPS
ncbi:MAG: hypothetical protein JRD68_11320 [Deltaproteobacteria bacterium]|nr:hypothetical protein [Deltaproteobacteria bacterium]